MRKGKINVGSSRPQLVFIDANDYIICHKNWRLRFLENISKLEPIGILLEPIMYYLYKKYMYIAVNELILLCDILSGYNTKAIFVGTQASTLEMAAAKEIQSLAFIDVMHLPMREIRSSISNKSALTLVSKNHCSSDKGFMHPEEILWKKKAY